MPKSRISWVAVILSSLLAVAYSDADAGQLASLRSGRFSSSTGSSSPPPGLEEPPRPAARMILSPAVFQPTWLREHKTGRQANQRTDSSMQGLSQRSRGYGMLDFSASTPNRTYTRKPRPLISPPEKPYFRSVIRSSPKLSYIRRRKPSNTGHIRNGGSSSPDRFRTSIVTPPTNSTALAMPSILDNGDRVSVSSREPSRTSQSANERGKGSALTNGSVIRRTIKAQLDVRSVNDSAGQRFHTADENEKIFSRRVKTTNSKVGKGVEGPIRNGTARRRPHRTKEFYMNRSSLSSTKKVQAHVSKAFETQPKLNTVSKTHEQKSETAPVELLGLYEVGLLPNTTEFLQRRAVGGPAKQSVARWSTGGKFVGNAGKVVFPLHVLPAIPGAPPAPDWPKIPQRPHRPDHSALPGYRPDHSALPGYPSQSHRPDHSALPGYRPDHSALPGYPSQSHRPDHSALPGYRPDHSALPGYPSQSHRPDHSGLPGYPSQSHRPDHSALPGYPSQSHRPDHSGLPGYPGQSHRPDHSGLPGYPSQSHRPARPGLVVPVPAPHRPVYPHVGPVKPFPAGTVEPVWPPNAPTPPVPSPFKPPTVDAGTPSKPGPSLPPSPPPPEGALGPPVTDGGNLICVYLRASGRPLLLHANLTSGQYNISDGLTHADSGQLQVKPQQTGESPATRETLILGNNATSVGDLIAQIRQRAARWKEDQKPFSNVVCIVQRQPEADPEAAPVPSDEPPSVPIPTKVTAPEADPTPASTPTVGDAMSTLSDSVSAAVDALTTSAGDTLTQTMTAADSTALVISANVKDYIGTNIPTIALATTVGIPVLVALLSLLGAPPLLLSALSVSSPVLMQSLASLYNMLPSG